LNQNIAHGLSQVLDLPQQKRDDQSCREFVASYVQDTALQTLEALIWGRNDDLDLDRWTKDEKLIRQRTLLLAERLAATKASNSASLDLPTLLDLSIVFYPTHPSRVRSLFSAALASSPSLKIAVEMETIPAFTQLFSPSDGAINTGLYGIRKAAHCLKSFIAPSPPEFTRLFALNEQFVVALAGAYDHGLSSLAASYGFTGSEDDPNAQDQKIFVETKVALMDSFHLMVKSGMVNAVVSGESNGDIQKVLGVLLTLADPLTTSSPQFPSNATSAGPVPFLNRTLLEDYHDAYDFTTTLTVALRNQEQDDARIDLFEAQLHSIRTVGGYERRPGALKILLHSSGIPLPRIDRKGKGRADPDRVDTPPPVNPSGDLDMKVTQVLDILPDTSPEYIRALLQHPDYSFRGNPERVIEALLEGNAPPMEDLRQPAVEYPHQFQESAQEQFVYTQGRRNIFDDRDMDLAHVRVGKKRWVRRMAPSAGLTTHPLPSGDASTVLQDKSEIERMKADILRRVEELSDEDEESDGEGYDEDDAVKVKFGGDGEESDEETGERPEVPDIDTILELAYIADPKQFDRDAQTRRSQARAKLRAQTGGKFRGCRGLVHSLCFL
jgi:activating signal cointegrator complex subunit 2